MRGGRAPFAVAAFLASFLLFSLELVSAKLILPSFGGAAYVWTTSLMVFQGLLLLGYLYAHGVLARWRYGKAHLVLLALPLLSFPIGVTVAQSGPPAARVAWSLLRAIGLPFFALSTTSTVLQAWRRRLAPDDPDGTYSIYAASNAGSLAALLAYPFLVEPRLLVRHQLGVWMALYAVFIALHPRLIPAGGVPEPDAPSETPATTKAAWLLLALGPSAALTAATNLLTLDFAAVPLLWIIPLALYLSTFVLNFKKNPWYPKRLSVTIVFVMLVWVVAVMLTVLYSADVSERWQALRRLWVVNKFVFINASLFVLCLICHRSLAKARPPAQDAPRYYALMALGGFLGSAWVALAMPLLARHTAMPELDWALAGGVSLGALVFRDWTSGARRDEDSAPSKPALAAVFLLGALGVAFYVKQSPAFEPGTVYSLRNFYGFYRVVDKEGTRRFYHGNTAHGVQSLDPARRREPMSYFHKRSPIGEALQAFPGAFPRAAVLGLGAGVLAAYGEPGQAMDFYELDPDVEAVARKYFTYLSDSRARVSVIDGDGRLSLSRAQGRYDLLVLDVFSGGSIPVHLLTREALDLYESRLNEGGVIAVHVTNRFLNLRPQLAALARERGLLIAGKMTPLEAVREEKYFSSWVILTRDARKMDKLRAAGWQGLENEPPVRVWTDDCASLLSALRS